ncbi:molybdopterin-containing oxidoreductase family protein [Adlercreutzia shanghongiae]|uniref:Molybdopterin-dependent oxidoreductase n=1 Tax=Adlercreutzia shanghongiae TaxID=3111773 RepID=A0ABU6IVN3_9ACTN|nr:molybdopterin-dependent oxidoreductase [Adlercreutzia sp. R22]MEC4293761.1 molybdopterin-dependent oxidoreductase [Adlercreutzia sp. R22]
MGKKTAANQSNSAGRREGFGPTLGRREFAAAAGASAVALALGGCASKQEPHTMPDTSVKDTVAANQNESLEKFRVTSGYNCCYCTIQGYKRDGSIVYIEPGELPGMPERNHACQRCMSWWQRAIDENERVMYPMKRTGERGSGQFERISWDEAIDLMAEKLNAALAKDPRSASFYIFTGNMCTFDWWAPVRMAHCLGATTWAMEGIMGDHATSVGFTMVTGNPDPGHDALDFLNSNLLLFFGTNMVDTIVPSARYLARAKEKGIKLVVLDPRLSSTAAMADQWIPINPGTDTALILAMMRVIIERDLHDKTWLANYSCAPLLVSDADGTYIRTENGAYCAWDTAADAMVEAAASQGEDDNTSGPENTWALTGNFEVNGVACHPAMDDLVAEVNKWTLDKAAEITGVDAATIEQLALDYANASPAAIRTCTGSSRYYHGYEISRAAATLSGLCGYTGRAGGGASRNNGGAPIDGASLSFTGSAGSEVPLMNSAEWDVVGDGESFGTYMGATLALYSSDPEAFQNARVFKSSEIYDAALTGKPVPIDFLYIATSNFINQSPDAHKIIDEVFPAIDFIVTADPFNTWTAQYSDLVLPASTWLENWDISTSGTGPYIRVNKPVLDRVGESKSDTEIMTLLAKKVGQEAAWSKTDEEWVRTFLDSDHPAFEGCNIEDVINEGILARADGIYDRATYPLGDKVFATPTGRLEFYTEMLYEFGAHVPTYLRGEDNPENKYADKYPLTFMQFHDRARVHTQHAHTKLLEVLEAEPHIQIHPDDAADRGIAHGDVVKIFNDRGFFKCKAQVTPGIVKGVIAMGQGWEPRDFIEGHYQYLTHYEKNPVEEAISMTNAAFYDVRAEVEKA